MLPVRLFRLFLTDRYGHYCIVLYGHIQMNLITKDRLSILVAGRVFFFFIFNDDSEASRSGESESKACTKYKARGSEATKNSNAKHKAQRSEATKNASAKPEGAKQPSRQARMSAANVGASIIYLDRYITHVPHKNLTGMCVVHTTFNEQRLLSCYIDEQEFHMLQ